jgi:hypothetical protein
VVIEIPRGGGGGASWRLARIKRIEEDEALLLAMHLI